MFRKIVKLFKVNIKKINIKIDTKIVKSVYLKPLFLLKIFVSCFLLSLFIPVDLKTDFSRLVVDEDGELLRLYLNSDEQFCMPVFETDTVPEKLKLAVLNFEDENFYSHFGVNPLSLSRAIYQNIKADKIISGASTLTMQLARINKKRPRTYLNKTIEIWEAMRIEVYYTKDEILKKYLTIAPFGSNVIGYKSAALKFFNTTPKELSWAQAALLAVLPNSPSLVNTSKHRNKLKLKRDKLLKKLYSKNILDQNSLNLALIEEIPIKTKSLEILAHHLSDFVLKKTKDKIVRTTLNLGIQKKVLDVYNRFQLRLKNQGVSNCICLVVDNTTSEVKAYIGSRNYLAKKDGTVDGIQAPRSSGSILKPFLYALAIDESILLPCTKIKDIPTYFGSFVPRNSNNKFTGLTTAKDALRKSLNIPAVRILNTVGLYKFYNFLKVAGISTLFRQADEYGLPLILGGCEVKAWDMAKLYNGLANYGVFSDLKILKSDTLKHKSVRLISKTACYLSLGMISELERPEYDYFWRDFESSKKISWKTGTSFGHKDAWAVGVTPSWTVVVWSGNFSGEGNKNLTGTRGAAPLLLDVFKVLPDIKEKNFYEPYDDIRDIEVCAETGFLAGKNCVKVETTIAPKHANAFKICPYHKTIQVDKSKKYEVCSYCWTVGHQAIKVLDYPPEITAQLKKNGNDILEILPHNPACSKHISSKNLKILYPREWSKLWIPKDFDGEFKGLVMKASGMFKSKVYWYLNNKHIATTQTKHTILVNVKTGTYKLFLIDEAGNSDQLTFYIKRRE